MHIVNHIHSFQEYPNHFPLVLFCAGCNLDCVGCYNKYDIVRDESIDNARQIIQSNINPLTKAIVLTGGEVTTWADLPDICWHIKRVVKLKVKIFTNGIDYDMINILCEDKLIDFISLDLKCVENAPTILGVPVNSNMYLDMVARVAKCANYYKIPFEVRTTVFPEVETQLCKIKKWYANNLAIYGATDHIIQTDFRKYKKEVDNVCN